MIGTKFKIINTSHSSLIPTRLHTHPQSSASYLFITAACPQRLHKPLAQSHQKPIPQHCPTVLEETRTESLQWVGIIGSSVFVGDVFVESFYGVQYMFAYRQPIFRGRRTPTIVPSNLYILASPRLNIITTGPLGSDTCQLYLFRSKGFVYRQTGGGGTSLQSTDQL